MPTATVPTPVTGTTRSVEQPIAETSLSRTAVVVTEDVVSALPAN